MASDSSGKRSFSVLKKQAEDGNSNSGIQPFQAKSVLLESVQRTTEQSEVVTAVETVLENMKTDGFLQDFELVLERASPRYELQFWLKADVSTTNPRNQIMLTTPSEIGVERSIRLTVCSWLEQSANMELVWERRNRPSGDQVLDDDTPNAQGWLDYETNVEMLWEPLNKGFCVDRSNNCWRHGSGDWFGTTLTVVQKSVEEPYLPVDEEDEDD